MRQLDGRLRGALVAWLFVLSAIAYLDRVNISIAGRRIAEDLGLSDIQLGWVFSAFVLGYALAQAPAGRLADRLGARAALTLAVIWWGVFSALTGAVPRVRFALYVLLAVRFALGLGEAVMYPAANRLVARWIPLHERGVANGLIFMGVGIGAALAPPLISTLLVAYGWRFSFVACALLGVAAGGAWWLLARNSPDEHPWLAQREREVIQAGIPSDTVVAARIPWRTI